MAMVLLTGNDLVWHVRSLAEYLGEIKNLSVNLDIWKFIIVSAMPKTRTISVWVYLNKYGVPRLLRWAERDGQKADDAANRPPPPARILLDLPQRPGNRVNDTVREASPASRSHSLSDGQQMYRYPASPVSAQINTDNGGKEPEAAEKLVWYTTTCGLQYIENM